MPKEPRRIVIKDKEQNIKSIQEYEYNSVGDPILFKKTDGENKILVHWTYEYKYNSEGEKIMMKISDLGTGKETIMEYEY